MLKQLFIPVAAFAVTATSVAAFQNVDWSTVDIDLSDNEITALEEAQEIRQAAHEEAESVLEDAGIDQDRLKEIRKALHESHKANRDAIHNALEAGDYAAFTAAVANTPLAEDITSEADFEKLLEAHSLREAGEHEAAKEIVEELGIERPDFARGIIGKGFGGPGHKGDRQSAEAE